MIVCKEKGIDNVAGLSVGYTNKIEDKWVSGTKMEGKRSIQVSICRVTSVNFILRDKSTIFMLIDHQVSFRSSPFPGSNAKDK